MIVEKGPRLGSAEITRLCVQSHWGREVKGLARHPLGGSDGVGLKSISWTLSSAELSSFLLLLIKIHLTSSFHEETEVLEPGRTGFMLLQYCWLLLFYPLLCFGTGVMFEFSMYL